MIWIGWGLVGSKTGDKGPTTVLAGVDRWIVLTTVGFQLISGTVEILMIEQISPAPALTHLTIAVVCFVMPWRPQVSLPIGFPSMALIPFGDEIGTDSIFFLLASAILAFRHGAQATLLTSLVRTRYGGLRGFKTMGTLDGSTEPMINYVALILLGVFLGLGTRGFHVATGCREV